MSGRLWTAGSPSWRRRPSKVEELRSQARGLFEGAELEFAYESLRLFALCEGTRWAHLPVFGGWYDQHPMLIDEWQIIMEEKAAHQKRKEEEERLKNRQKPF